MRRRDFCRGVVATALGALTARATVTKAKKVIRELFSENEHHFVAIGPFQEFGEGHFLFDYSRLRAGKLVPQAESTFALAPTFDGSGDAVAQVKLDGSGLQYAGAAFRRVKIRRRTFTVQSGGVSLFAELAHIAGREPRGTILLIYGSGAAPLEAFDFWAFHFLSRNWAVVTYDKRGSGRSTGDWRLSNLEALASDAMSVLAHARQERFLANRPFGVWGASQAGWIMPQLGAAGTVDFIVMHAGPATAPAEQVLLVVDAELKAYGFSIDEIARAKAYYSLDIDVSRGRAHLSDIEKAYAAATQAKAEWLLAPPLPANAPDRTFMRSIADFDPAPYWKRSKAPLLAIFGGKDVIVPAEPNARLLKGMMAPGAECEILVLANANHLGMVADTGVRAEYAKRTSIDPGYFSAISRWLNRWAQWSATDRG